MVQGDVKDKESRLSELWVFVMYMGDLCTTYFGPKGLSSGNGPSGPNHVVNRSPIYVTKTS